MAEHGMSERERPLIVVFDDKRLWCTDVTIIFRDELIGVEQISSEYSGVLSPSCEDYRPTERYSWKIYRTSE